MCMLAIVLAHRDLQISKKLVNSDYKNNRVEDPTKISDKQQKNVKKYVKDFFDRAVEKDKERQKRKALKKAAEAASSTPTGTPNEPTGMNESNNSDDEEKDVAMSDNEDEAVKVKSATPTTPLDPSFVEGLKRKRDADLDRENVEDEQSELTPKKRLKSESPPPPPTPPPPPAPVNGAFHDFEGPDGDLGYQDDVHAEGMPIEAAIAAMSEAPSPPATAHPGASDVSTVAGDEVEALSGDFNCQGQVGVRNDRAAKSEEADFQRTDEVKPHPVRV